MHAKKLIILLVALLTVTAYAPTAMATHDFAIRGDMGPDNVKHEPNYEDADGNALEGNGFPSKSSDADYFTPDQASLILESFYASGTYPRYVDNSQIMNQALGNDPGNYQYYILPGMSQFTAFWGWWNDADQDGVIDDEYDADTSSSDELVMRGQSNIDQASYNATLGTWAEQLGFFHTKTDVMYGFIHPGTWDDQFNQAECYYSTGCKIIRPTADSPNVPDIQFDDRTYQDSGSGFYGWLGEGGWNSIAYDGSLIITTQVTTSVNPTKGTGGEFEPTSTSSPVGEARTSWFDQGNASKEQAFDVDVYQAINPALTTAYRTAVYDPGNEAASPLDAAHPDGPKQFAKEGFEPVWQAFWEQYDIVTSEVNSLVAGTTGPVDDLAFRPRALEPNTCDTADLCDTHPGVDATVTSALVYGGSPYFEGTPDMWQAYEDGEQVWMDIQPYYGCAYSYTVQIRFWCGDNAFVVPTSGTLGDASEGGNLPGFLWLDGYIGSWLDKNGDGFIGALDEQGRTTSSADPYASGAVDDPNDYGDRDYYHKGGAEPQPAKVKRDEAAGKNTAEWTGTDCAGSITALVHPATSWGAAGVYHVEDADNAYFNPYDDILGDAIGFNGEVNTPTSPQVDVLNDDGQQLNRHYTGSQPIPISFTCETQISGQPGLYHGDDMILFPTGNIETDVYVVSEGTLSPEHTARDGSSLGSAAIKDVDYIPSTI